MNDTDSTQYTVDTVKTKTAVSTVEMNQATAEHRATTHAK